jgi:hypothetical protein
MALDFGTSLDHYPLAESLRGLGGAEVLDLEDQDKVAAVVIPPKKPKPCPNRGDSAVIFWGWWDLVFAGVLAKTGWLDVVFWW